MLVGGNVGSDRGLVISLDTGPTREVGELAPFEVTMPALEGMILTHAFLLLGYMMVKRGVTMGDFPIAAGPNEQAFACVGLLFDAGLWLLAAPVCLLRSGSTLHGFVSGSLIRKKQLVGLGRREVRVQTLHLDCSCYLVGEVLAECSSCSKRATIDLLAVCQPGLVIKSVGNLGVTAQDVLHVHHQSMYYVWEDALLVQPVASTYKCTAVHGQVPIATLYSRGS